MKNGAAIRFRYCLAVLALALLAPAAIAQEGADGPAPLTVHLVIAGDVDPQLVYIFRYAVEGDQQPTEQFQLCGGFPFPGATSTISGEPCENGRRYTAAAELEPGTQYGIQVASMHPSDPEGTFQVHAQSFENRSPQPGEYLTFHPGSTHWVWVNPGAGQ